MSAVENQTKHSKSESDFQFFRGNLFTAFFNFHSRNYFRTGFHSV